MLRIAPTVLLTPWISIPELFLSSCLILPFLYAAEWPSPCFFISFFLQLLQPMMISSAPTCCGHYILSPSVCFLIPCCSILLSSCFMLFFCLFTTPPDCRVLGARDHVFLNHPLTQACWPQISQIFVGDCPPCLHALPPAPALLLPMTNFPFQLRPAAALACLLQISLK